MNDCPNVELPSGLVLACQAAGPGHPIHVYDYRVPAPADTQN